MDIFNFNMNSMVVENESKQLLQEKEETFFESHFEYGDDKETVKCNYDTALELYIKHYFEVSEYAEMLEDGECFDEATCIFDLESMLFAYKNLLIFKEQLGGPKKVVDLEELRKSNDVIDEKMVGFANGYIEEFEEKRNFGTFELGKYILFAAEKKIINER